MTREGDVTTTYEAAPSVALNKLKKMYHYGSINTYLCVLTLRAKHKIIDCTVFEADICSLLTTAQKK